jgi:hypothetical protein
MKCDVDCTNPRSVHSLFWWPQSDFQHNRSYFVSHQITYPNHVVANVWIFKVPLLSDRPKCFLLSPNAVMNNLHRQQASARSTRGNWHLTWETRKERHDNSVLYFVSLLICGTTITIIQHIVACAPAVTACSVDTVCIHILRSQYKSYNIIKTNSKCKCTVSYLMKGKFWLSWEWSAQ